jgi:hypothetical protein
MPKAEKPARQEPLPVTTNAKQSVLDTILIRAAEQLGDVTEPIMAAYYEQFPEGRKIFTEHGIAGVSKLEAEMVETTLYCMAYWFENKLDVQIILDQTVPHHVDTLRIPLIYFAGLITVAAEVLGETIPNTSPDEKLIWDELIQALDQTTTQALQSHEAILQSAAQF